MNSKTLLYDSLKSQAIKLRKQGKTYTEITKELQSIPKSTLSGWLKDIELKEEHAIRIKNLMIESGHSGRWLGAQKNHLNRLARLEKIKSEAEVAYFKNKFQSDFIAGLVLYLAEGSKKSEQFMFMNSDYKLVRYMLAWVLSYGNKDIEDIRFRLYIHEIYANENCEKFWREALNIDSSLFLKTIYKPTGRQHKKNPKYKGCIRLEVKGGNELYWRTMTWRECFYKDI